jgi:hypothetical protein
VVQTVHVIYDLMDDSGTIRGEYRQDVHEFTGLEDGTGYADKIVDNGRYKRFYEKVSKQQQLPICSARYEASFSLDLYRG